MARGRPWSEGEDYMLRKAGASGASVSEFALMYGRTVMAVKARAQVLAVSFERKPKRDPDKALVLRIAQEAAMTSSVTLTEILEPHGSADAKAVRLKVWKRIMAETGCKAPALARAWGCGPEAIRNAIKGRREPAAIQRKPTNGETYDDATQARLRWQHGYDRAESIIKGEDPATNADIAAWRRLCERAA